MLVAVLSWCCHLFVCLQRWVFRPDSNTPIWLFCVNGTVFWKRYKANSTRFTVGGTFHIFFFFFFIAEPSSMAAINTLAELVSKLGYRLNKCESPWLTGFIAWSCIAWQWTCCVFFFNYCSTFCFPLQSCYPSCKSIACDIHLCFDARLRSHHNLERDRSGLS